MACGMFRLSRSLVFSAQTSKTKPLKSKSLKLTVANTDSLLVNLDSFHEWTIGLRGTISFNPHQTCSTLVKEVPSKSLNKSLLQISSSSRMSMGEIAQNWPCFASGKPFHLPEARYVCTPELLHTRSHTSSWYQPACPLTLVTGLHPIRTFRDVLKWYCKNSQPKTIWRNNAYIVWEEVTIF